jgi:hypothetical protein
VAVDDFMVLNDIIIDSTDDRNNSHDNLYKLASLPIISSTLHNNRGRSPDALSTIGILMVTKLPFSIFHAAAKQASFSFVSKRCKCKGTCMNKTCKCRKSGVPCSSKCHSGHECENVIQVDN